MSDSSDEKPKLNNELLSDKELYEIFEFHYDDLFCKILKISEKSFIYFLKQQVLFNLQIIKRNSSSETLKAYLDLFIKRYKENQKLVKKNFDFIKQQEQKEDNNLIYLDMTKCYIHCHKCSDIFHKCGKKLILYDEHVYCIKCNNVYNKNQIMLFCQACNKNYLSKLRKPVFNGNKKYEKLFLLKFKRYHCDTKKEEKIKCLKCSNNLYFRFSQHNQTKEDNINVIYCIKCKLKYSIKDVFFKCKICLKNFKSEAKIFRDFPSKKKKLLFIIHTLLRNKNALPDLSLCERTCACKLKNVKQYFHKEDKGKFLEGIKNNKTSVVCGKCFKIFQFNEITWNCPDCDEEFKYIKSSNNLMDLGEETEEITELRKIPVFKVNLNKIHINKNKNEYKEKPIIENGAKKNELIQNDSLNNNIKIIMNKRIINKNNINLDNNINKVKKILINQNEDNKANIKVKYTMRKSRSKNNITINKYKHSNRNVDIKNILNKNRINIDKSKEKAKNKIQDQSNDNNSNSNNEKNNVNNDNPNKKAINNNIDTTKIFNQILDNIYNIEDPYFMLNQKKEDKIKGQKGEQEIIEKNEKNRLKPRSKLTQYFENTDLNINNIYQDKSFFIKEENMNNNLIQEQKVDNKLNSSRKLKSNDYFDNSQLDKSDKKHIKYAKKIYLFNGKKGEKENLRVKNKIQPNNLFIKYIKHNYYNRNKEQNVYESNDEYIYSNDISSYQNYDNYEMNYQNYNKEYHPINLYNFTSDNYSTIKLLGKGANGKIYLVLDMQTNQNFAIKSILIDNELQIKSEEEEYYLIYKLNYEKPELNIVNIYGLEIRRIDKFNIFFNVLMEAAICDWEMEIISRKNNNKYYTEEELLYILSSLIGTLSYLQQRNISHRDLKPQNILYFGNNEYKICDFGEAKYSSDKKGKNIKKETNLTFDYSKQTIRGTELYMSPILFNAVKYKPNSLTTYNSFKSDVFSLGLCFLHASSLDTNILYKIREISDMNKIMKIVYENLGRRYSQNYMNILLYMLQIDENYRPDFIELNSWLIFGNE